MAGRQVARQGGSPPFAAFCLLCGAPLPESLFSAKYARGAIVDVARISVRCPHCGTEVNIAAGLRPQQPELPASPQVRELSAKAKAKARQRLTELERGVDEWAPQPENDDNIIDAEIVEEC
jgi:hypothetical protein